MLAIWAQQHFWWTAGRWLAQSKIWATARTPETLEKVKQQFGVQVTLNNHEAIRQSDIVVLCVKPQMMKSVLQELAPTLQESKPLLISVAAGINLDSLQSWSGGNPPGDSQHAKHAFAVTLWRQWSVCQRAGFR